MKAQSSFMLALALVAVVGCASDPRPVPPKVVTQEVESWSAVNAIWDVIHENPKVWVMDFRLLEGDEAQREYRRIDPESKEGVRYGITIQGRVQGDEVSALTRFRNCLKSHPALSKKLPIVSANLDWRIVRKTDRDDEFGINFTATLFGQGTP